MRIISGSAGGRTIQAPQSNNTRPTHDRVREALFSMIGPYFNGGSVLDLFAGSGSLGLEALSRGMDHAVFCDKDRQAVRVVQENCKALDFTSQCRIVCGDWRNTLNSLVGQQFDLIFLDPPYEAGFYLPALEQIADKALLKENGVIFCEMRSGCDFAVPKPYTLWKTRTYGMAQIFLLKEESYE